MRYTTPTGAEFRRVMGLFPTGVTVLTSADGPTVRAMTANSLTSVSLDPLSLLVCVNREAIMHGVLSSSRVFCVNILGDQQEGFARACARPDSAESVLEGVPFRTGATGAPVLEGALAHIECSVATSLDFGTHTIFVGLVVGLGSAEGGSLMFSQGQYARFDNARGG